MADQQAPDAESATDSKIGDESTQDSKLAKQPPLPPRQPNPPPTPLSTPAQQQTGTSSKFAQAKTTAVKYSKFWLEHVKKGEMPWTQWYCCGVVNGQECETENHRLKKVCKKCGHRVCENCVKGKL